MRKTTDDKKGRTWFLDIDGTIFLYAGIKGAPDIPVPGVAQFFDRLPPEDVVVLTTSRGEDQKVSTETALWEAGFRYDTIVWGLPPGIRILVNDQQEDGLPTAWAINVDRNRSWAEMADGIPGE